MLCATFPGSIRTAGEWHKFKCQGTLDGIAGATIEVRNTKNEPLNFCGIKVFGALQETIALEPYGAAVSIAVTGDDKPFLLNDKGQAYV